jgi:uncharacterized RDD family membrane protein YckC
VTQEPRDPNAPPPQTPEGDPPVAPEQGGSPPPQGAAAPPPQQSWQSQAQQPGPPPASGGVAAAAPLPAGPIEGTQIADFVTRLVAFIIDAVILGIANYIVWAIAFAILPLGIDVLVYSLAVAAVSAAYFVYFWTTRRQTPGMIVMKLLVVEDGTGATLTQDKAIRRWAFLGLPYALSVFLGVGGFGFGFLGGLAILFTLAFIVAIAALGWQIYLAYTTYQDPPTQGAHDKFVNSVVVSYGPSPFSQQAPR